MSKSRIEITEKEYLIKLSKSEFAYPIVRKVMSKLLNGSFHLDDESGGGDDIIDRYAPELFERFDFLGDK